MTDLRTRSRFTGVDFLSAVSIIGCVAIAAVLAFAAPTGPVPLRMAVDGQVFRWGDRIQAAILALQVAVLCLAMSGFCAIIANRARASSSLVRSLRLGQAIIGPIAVGGSLFDAAASFGLLTDAQFTAHLNMALISILCAIIGAILGKTTANPFVGLRFIWSLTSRRAWDRSNRLMGRLWFWGGLAGLAAAPFAPEPMGVYALVGWMLLVELIATYESWRVWRTDPERRSMIETMRSWGDLFRANATAG